MSPRPLRLSAPNTDLIAGVFDALPLPAFVVDRDFNVIDFNLAGAKLLDRVPFAVLRLRGGDGVRCIHSVGVEDDACPDPCEACVVKNFVREVFSEAKPCRKTGRLQLTRDGKTDDVDFLITVAPFHDDSETLAVLILDDAAELSALLDGMTSPAIPVSSSPDSTGPAKALAHKTDNS